MKNKKIGLDIIIFLLLLLWIPVTLDKIINFNSYQSAILRQPLPGTLAHLVIYILPILEITTVGLLLINSLRQIGLLLSTLLMTLFTSYVAIALLGTWGKLPCGCGSVIHNLGWTEHLLFNITYLLISILGLIFNLKIRKESSLIVTN